MMNGENRPARILVVDDVPDTLDLLTNWLEVQGFATLQARSGQQALDLASSHKPDLILLDVMMPKMDGIETCRQLKARPQTANIPVILVSAKDPSDARADGMMAGAVDYITKPVNLQDLTTRVESALATDFQAPVDVQRLLAEVAHTALAVLGGSMVWLLNVDDISDQLVSQALATNSGSRAESDFLSKAGVDHAQPRFSLDDTTNPLCSTLLTRKTVVNLPTKRLQESPSTAALFTATEQLHLTYVTIVPLIAAGKIAGVMVLGSHQPYDMESSRAQQILSSFASQAAIALDYSRLSGDLSRREAERRNEQTFRQMILDTMSDALVVIDSKGIIKYVNRRMLRMTSYSETQLVGRSVGEIFHPDDRDEVMTGLLRENAATMKFDQRLLTQDNRVIPVLLSRSRSQTNQFDSQVIVLSDMTVQKEREEALERQTRRLIALNEAAQIIASNLSLHDTLKDILNAATNVVEAQGASLFLFSRDNPNELVVVAAVGYRADDLIGLRVPLGEGLAGWVAREAKSQLVTDLENDPRFYRQVDQQTGMNTQSLIAVPLIHAEQVIGVIEVVNKLNNAVFDLDDVRLLESMAGTASVSIINARLFDQAQRRVVELGTLLDASEAASSTLDFANVLKHITRSLTGSLEAARCLVMSWNDFKNRLEALAEVSHTHWQGTDGPLHVLETDSFLREALTGGQTVMRSLQDIDLSAADREQFENSGMSSALAVPIRLHRMVAGLAVLQTHDGGARYTSAEADQARRVLAAWEQMDCETLADLDAQTIRATAEALLKIGRTSWVTLHMGSAQAEYTRLVYETGFAEWTHRAGASIPLDDYPTIRGVIVDKRYRIMTLNEQPQTEREWLERRGGQSCLMVPLISHGAATGMVMLIDIRERKFDNQEINLAQGIANVVSNAMENARLFQSLQSRAKALESAYAELQAADKAKDEFIQNVSHELRTPLIHVLGYAELLAEGDFGEINDEQRAALRTIAEKGQRVADIVEDMVSTQAKETRFYDRKPLDISTIIQQVLEMYKKSLQAAGLRVLTHFPPKPPMVLADAQLIAEAFEKLLDNAIKFGAGGEKIEILVRDPGGPMMQIAIRDYGIGIDPSEHEKIFQRFYQVDGGAARRYGGTGLGLSVAKTIIEGHSGRIGVKSRLNEGSIFHFTLPKADLIRS